MRISKHKKLPRLHALAVVAAISCGGAAWALPQGATVVNGNVTISQPLAGKQVINASNGAIINWKQFSIGRGETTQFVQPSSSSAVLNRVVGADVSQLLGQLKANGQVFLINPNGIVVGSGARIDTNGFVASTLDIADADFLAGKLRFFAGSGAGRVRNDGVITVGPGGRIALIAPDIDNTGIIEAPGGQILLAAGRKLEIASLDIEGVTFEIQAPTDSALNLGKLLAENGVVQVFAGNLRQSGEIRANRLVRTADGSIMLAGSNDLVLTIDSITDASGLHGGNITLQSSGGKARVAGQVSATGSAGDGGNIRVLGERVALDAGALIDVSGSAGGGQILVGGDFQGRNPDVQNASRVHVAAGAQLHADATDQGDGGRIIVWADQDTRYAGSLSARGGVHGGDGGFAEVSGKRNLEFTGSASLSAHSGAHGTLLLDPLDLIVSANSGLLPVVADEFTDFIGNVVTIAPATLAAVGGNVTLQAARDIYIKDALSLSTPGAGVSITAGGAAFDSGSIFNNAGINTVGGAVTLRAASISGGSIVTNGGAVDILTPGTLNYGGGISSGGGVVTLGSQSGSVNNANVDAGAGAIEVTGQSGVFGGVYTTSGVANIRATAGSISINTLTAGTASFTATGSINGTVEVTDRVNASSSGSSVSLSGGSSSAPLRLGTLTSNSGIFLSSSNGLAQASGGLLTAPSVQVNLQSGTGAAGSQAAPIIVAAPSTLNETEIRASNMNAPVHFAFSGSPTLRSLSLQGSVSAVGTSTVAAGTSANLSALTLAAAGGVLSLSASSTAGLTNGFIVNVNDGAINAPSLTLPGAPVTLTSSGAVTIGTMTGGDLTVQAKAAVDVTSATTTGNSGINLSTQGCVNGTTACLLQSPVTAGTLSAGGSGDVRVTTLDNGNITINSLSAGDAINIQAGRSYRTSPFSSNFTDQPTTNTIQLGTTVSTGRANITNSGQGDLTITGLTAGDAVDVRAGVSFTPVAFTTQRTNNIITIANAEPAAAIGDFRVTNTGIGTLAVTGAVDRSNSGDINFSTFDGSLNAIGNLTARDTIIATAGGAAGALTLGTLVSGSASFNGNVTLSAGANVVFGNASSTAPGITTGNVTMTSTNGSIKTTVNNTAADIVASGNVTLTANHATNGVIGDSTFANPLDIRAGTGKVVTLSAGLDIGAAGEPVTVDADGSLIVTAANGQFHAAATDGTTEKSLSTIRLSASAAGVGAANTARFTSLDLDVTANSDGNMLTIGDLVRSAGTLNEFQFAATGTSALTYGNVNFGSGGLNQLVLGATNGLAQTTPLVNSITAGTASLASGAGNLSVGDITARSARLSGGAMALRSVTTSGTARSTANSAIPDTLTVSSSSDVVVTGALNSATVVDVNSGGNLSVAGAVTGTGATRSTFRAAADQVRLVATGDITVGGAVTSLTSTAVQAGGSVLVGGSGIDGGVTAPFGNNLNDAVTVTASMSGTINTQAITDGFSKTVTGGTLIVPGGITGTAQNTTITGTTFNTGNLSSGSALTINATAAYAPGAAIALSAPSNIQIDAPSGIDLITSGSTLTSPSVTMTTEAGNIAASLTNTTGLTLTTGGNFAVTSNVALSSLTVTADGALAGAAAGSSVSANGGGQLLGYVTTGASLALQMASNSSLTNRYTESSSAITDMVLNSTGTFNGSANVSAPAANISTPALAASSGVTLSTNAGDLNLSSLSAASINLFTGTGHINLTSVNSAGSSITARTTGDATKEIRVQSVVSVGGSVALTADNGNIVRAGAQPLQIDSRNGQGLASGTMTLSAANGSVGTAATPILTSGASTLTINGKNDISVGAANTPVANLNLTTSASGTGAVSVTNTNFAGLAVTRSGGTDLDLSALTPGTAAGFSLTATDGNIRVIGDLGNLTSLTLDAGSDINTTGDLVILAAGGPRAVSANTFSLRAGRDIRLAAGALAGENVAVSQTGNIGATSLNAGRDIVISADGGSALLLHAATSNTQTLSAGRDIKVLGGSAGIAAASAAVNSAAFQTVSASGDLLVQGGTSNQSSARIAATQSQSMTQILGTIGVQGGAGADAFAEIVSSASSQNLGTTSSVTDLVQVIGGAGGNAYASIRAFASQNILSSGDVRVLGGSGAGANAELSAGSSQTVGNTSVPNFSFNDPTNAILVQAGSGGTARILAGGNQVVRGGEGLSVLGGSATGMSASIETTAGTQSIGTSSTNQNDPTGDVLMQAGTGDGAFAMLKASGSQTINTGGLISVLGGSGVGASAEIVSTTGSQTIGATSTSSNDPTDSILVRAGSGGLARIQAQGNQTIQSGGNLSVIGGDNIGLTAAIESIGGSQNIGSTGIFSNDASGSVLVQAGTATGTAAWIRAATGQTVDAGGSITLTASLAGAFADMSTTSGSQTIGNNTCCSNDNTDSISLTGGSAAGAFAKIATGGFQSLRSAGDLTLLAGSGDDSGARILAGTGQNLSVLGNLAMTGGSGSAPGLNETSIRNASSGSQTISVSGSIDITGGGMGSNTWIQQGGAGLQSVSASGSLTLLAPAGTPSDGVTSLESLAGGQSLNIDGAITVTNAGATAARISTSGAQTMDAASLAISVSSTSGTAPFAGLTATGDQTITLNGDFNTPGTATLSILNLSPTANSSAAITTQANLVVEMDYNAAGLMNIGSTGGQGVTTVAAAGDMTIVAGRLLLQGGATATSDARLLAGVQPPGAPTNTMWISTLYGSVDMIGGAGGGAYIDPLQLDIVSTGSVLMLAGVNSTANSTITAGTVNLAATAGSLSLINSTTSSAIAAINTGTFNLVGSNNLNLNGGTINVSNPSTISILGSCSGCDTGLVPFNLFDVAVGPPPPVLVTDFGAVVVGDLLALADQSTGMVDLLLDDSGNLVFTRRRLNQCY